MSENEMTESENVTTMVIDDDDDPVVGVKKNLEAVFGSQDVVDKAFWETRIIADSLDQKNIVCALGPMELQNVLYEKNCEIKIKGTQRFI